MGKDYSQIFIFFNSSVPEFCTLIGNVFDDPSSFKIEIFAIHTIYRGSVTNGLRIKSNIK